MHVGELPTNFIDTVQISPETHKLHDCGITHKHACVRACVRACGRTFVGACVTIFYSKVLIYAADATWSEQNSKRQQNM